MRSMGADKEQAYRQAMAEAIEAGAAHLASGGSAIEAAVQAVAVMEASGALNAGLGSCLSFDGIVEADAAVMDGAELDYGAVATVPRLGNAVALAEQVRRHSAHCMLAGEGALRTAAMWPEFTPVLVPDDPVRRARWAELKAARASQVETTDALTQLGGTHDDGDTVGAVALDARGGLAAAVSTGGLWLKRPGRVGDSPLAGAGLWAEDGVVACCATGTGEFIMRTALCADVRARVQAGADVDTACRDALRALEARFGWGRAGLIGVDSEGRISAPFATTGMGRGWMRAGDTAPTVRVWPEDDPEGHDGMAPAEG
jgi:beta-aspartyl-peptidase (threonine type)